MCEYFGNVVDLSEGYEAQECDGISCPSDCTLHGDFCPGDCGDD